MDNWLDRVNEELNADGIEPRQRPWEAMKRYGVEFKIPVSFPSTTADRIFKYFSDRSRPGTHDIGPMYQSVFLYESSFWPFSVPIHFGTTQIAPFDAFSDMPEVVMSQLASNRKVAGTYLIYWAECYDYACGMGSVEKKPGLDPFGLKVFAGAVEELRSAVSLLSTTHPEKRAILTSRMAVELFIKAFLALRGKLTEKQAIAISHDLDKALTLMVAEPGFDSWEAARSELSVFPPVTGRYEGQAQVLTDLWRGLALAQRLGSAVVRDHVPVDMLARLLRGDAQHGS